MTQSDTKRLEQRLDRVEAAIHSLAKRGETLGPVPRSRANEGLLEISRSRPHLSAKRSPSWPSVCARLTTSARRSSRSAGYRPRR